MKKNKLHEGLVIVNKPRERQSRLEEIPEDDEEQDYADPILKKTLDYSNSFKKLQESHFNFDNEGSSSDPQAQPDIEQGVEEDEDWCGFDDLSLSSELQTHPDKGKGVDEEDWCVEVGEDWCDEEDDDEN
uniref:Uncharacterized protein n=1 Tax=Meloidogyne javanica TaxID=6303 RepID=A0A915MA52_MELJA